MADISACNGLKDLKGKILQQARVLGVHNSCELRRICRRYEAHLNATSKQQSYIKAAFVGQSCEFLKE